MTPILFLFCGIPGSGKTTLRKELMKRVVAAVVSTDDYLEKWAQESGLSYSECFTLRYPEASEQAENDVDQAVDHRMNLIWDQTNLSPKKRKRIVKQFREKGYYIIGINFLRNYGSVHNIPLDILNYLKERFHPIDQEDGCHDICTSDQVWAEFRGNNWEEDEEPEEKEWTDEDEAALDAWEQDHDRRNRAMYGEC